MGQASTGASEEARTARLPLPGGDQPLPGAPERRRKPHLPVRTLVDASVDPTNGTSIRDFGVRTRRRTRRRSPAAAWWRGHRKSGIDSGLSWGPWRVPRWAALAEAHLPSPLIGPLRRRPARDAASP